MCKRSAVAAGYVSLLLLSLSSSNALGQSSATHAHYAREKAQPTLRETLTGFLREGSPAIDYEFYPGACDMTCDAGGGFACDGDYCDGMGCDGCGRCGHGGAFCLLGGHDIPYDLAHNTFGLAPESCFDIGGWTQFGYSNRSTGQFNSHPNRLNNHQTWLFMEKIADGNLGLDWGFRVDAMYGVDAADTQAFGNSPGVWDYENGFDHGIYGFAMPQLYAEIAWGDLSIKGGHFFTPLGYEVVPAPGNFFYSHSFTMYNSEPFTHTGALATYRYDDDITLYGGWTAGWDTGFDQFDNGSNFLGGATLQLTETSTFTWLMTLGDFGKIGDGYSQSLVLDIAFTDSVNYVIQSDLLHTNEDTSYGVNQYLLCDLNEWLAAGARAEWWRLDGISYYEVTAGFNVRPTGNLIIRPEVRYQYSPAGNDFSGIQNAKNPAGLPLDEGAIFGIDAILTF